MYKINKLLENNQHKEKNMNPEERKRKEKIFTYQDLVDYQSDSIVSSQLIDRDEGSVTVFAFDREQKLSEHTAPYDALVQVVEGRGLFKVLGKEVTVSEGEVLIMPAGKPHAVHAEERFKMVLTMIRSGDDRKK